MICRDRNAAVAHLLENSNCNIVISDDGLQHYRLHRDIEIAMVDGTRRFGNKFLIPAGPLRESTTRLNKVDFIVVKEGNEKDQYVMSQTPNEMINIKTSETLAFHDFTIQTIHAVAGIAYPERFFALLSAAGFNIIPHVLPDHHLYHKKDLAFNDNFPIVMTEKDAIKCHAFADDRYWYVKIDVKINDTFKEKLLAKIKHVEVYHA